MTFLTLLLFCCNVSLSTDPHNESRKAYQASKSSQNRRKGEAKQLINIYLFSCKQHVAFHVLLMELYNSKTCGSKPGNKFKTSYCSLVTLKIIILV